MNTYNKVVIAFILSAVVFSGCIQTKIPESTETPTETVSQTDDTVTPNNNPTETNDSKDQTSEDSTNTNNLDESFSEILGEFKTLLNDKVHPSILATYLKEHANTVKPSDVEAMIEWLTLYHTTLIQDTNDRLYVEDDFSNAFFSEMNGQLTPKNIARVSDANLKESFEGIYNAYITIIRYEETPVFSTDWGALETYATNVSDEFGYLLKMNSKYQYYFGQGFEETLADMAVLEKRIESASSPFVINQLRNLHRSMISDVFIGPEGSYIGTFIDKNNSPYTSDLYQILLDYSANNPDAYVSGLITTLNESNTDDYMTILNIINDATSFYYPYSRQWHTEETQKDGRYIRTIELVDNNTDFTSKINEAIQLAVSKLESEAPEGYNTTITMYPDYSGETIISMNISASYTNDDYDFVNTDVGLNFDAVTGDILTLSSYLGVPEDQVLEALLDITKQTYTLIPGFTVRYDGGLILYRNPSADSDPDYQYIAPGSLIGYVDKNNLIW